jgi:type VI secretion system ImpM family protein
MTGFLFGKLPAFGDFVTRGLPVGARAWWDDRCSALLVAAQERFGDTFHTDYAALPPRCFLLPIDGAWCQVGCVMPSIDRAGRAFPFVWGVSSAGRIDEARGAAIAERIAARLDDVRAPRINLDALAATAAHLAGDTASARRAISPIALAPFPHMQNASIGMEI